MSLPTLTTVVTIALSCLAPPWCCSSPLENICSRLHLYYTLGKLTVHSFGCFILRCQVSDIVAILSLTNTFTLAPAFLAFFPHLELIYHSVDIYTNDSYEERNYCARQNLTLSAQSYVREQVYDSTVYLRLIIHNVM